METVYRGRDNTIRLQLIAGETGTTRQPVDLTPVTRMTLFGIGSGVIDSDVSAGVFDWTIGDGKVDLLLGGLDITAGKYNASLFVYDLDHPNGLFWASFLVRIV